MRVCFRLSAFYIITMLAGCAGTTIEKEHRYSHGVRYYESAPFMLVHTDSKGGLVSKLIWLPDTTRVMTVRPWAVASKNDATFKFANGVMTQAKSDIDTSVIPVAIVNALKTAAIARATGATQTQAMKSGAEKTVPAPKLFRIRNEGGKWWFAGGSADPEIIDVSSAKKETP